MDFMHRRIFGQKVPAPVIFAESGVTAEEFIKTGNWKQLADKYLVSLLILESPKWEKEQIEREFDYAWTTVYH